jgi:hypothetical protein
MKTKQWLLALEFCEFEFSKYQKPSLARLDHCFHLIICFCMYIKQASLYAITRLAKLTNLANSLKIEKLHSPRQKVF